MNILQKRYAVALAAKEAMNTEEHETEKRVLAEMNITDEDGNPAEYIFTIENEDLFHEACKRLEDKLKSDHYYDRYATILNEYNAACDALIRWALGYFAIYHPAEAEKLREASTPGVSHRIRQKLIDFAFHAEL